MSAELSAQAASEVPSSPALRQGGRWRALLLSRIALALSGLLFVITLTVVICKTMPGTPQLPILGHPFPCQAAASLVSHVGVPAVCLGLAVLIILTRCSQHQSPLQPHQEMRPQPSHKHTQPHLAPPPTNLKPVQLPTKKHQPAEQATQKDRQPSVPPSPFLNQPGPNQTPIQPPSMSRPTVLEHSRSTLSAPAPTLSTSESLLKAAAHAYLERRSSSQSRRNVHHQQPAASTMNRVHTCAITEEDSEQHHGADRMATWPFPQSAFDAATAATKTPAPKTPGEARQTERALRQFREAYSSPASSGSLERISYTIKGSGLQTTGGAHEVVTPEMLAAGRPKLGEGSDDKSRNPLLHYEDSL